MAGMVGNHEEPETRENTLRSMAGIVKDTICHVCQASIRSSPNYGRVKHPIHAVGAKIAGGPGTPSPRTHLRELPGEKSGCFDP